MNNLRKLGGLAFACLALAATALADSVQTLSWDDLIPEDQRQQQQLMPHDPSADAFDLNDDSFEDAFSTPVLPMGVVDALNEKKVKLPGFVVPLEMVDEGKVREFLLVPYFGACIHYPAPPPNQIVYVTMEEPIELQSMWDPVWLTGELKTEPRRSELASSSYTMAGELLEMYEY